MTNTKAKCRYKCISLHMISFTLTTSPVLATHTAYIMSEDIPQVFVDDSDPSIVYRGQDAWAVQTGIPTAPLPFNLPARAPFYGTMHQVEGSGSFSYIFNGTAIHALFETGGNDSFISSCMLDGKEQKADLFPVLEGTLCEWGDISDGQHNLTVSVFRDRNKILTTVIPYLDGLFYTPSDTMLLQEVDIAYGPLHGNNTSGGFEIPGESVDMNFNGSVPAQERTSMAMYITFSWGDNVPVNLSYTVDGGPTINFTVDNPSTAVSAVDQLILQTPQYAQGQHHLHVDFLGPGSDVQSLAFDHFFVQNAPHTRKLALAPFPPINSSNITSTAQPDPSSTDNTSTIESASHHTPQRTIVAIAGTLPAVLTVLILSLLYMKRRSLRRNHATRNAGDGSEVTVTPFIPGIFARRLMYPSSKRMLDSVPDLPRVAGNVSKANRLVPPSHNPTRTSALPEPIPVSTPTPALTRTPIAVPVPTAPPALPAAQDGTEEPIYRIHEDGGSVHEASSTAPGQRQVIDLPPLYSSNFGRRQEPPEELNAGG
ncbi:hypothetical protein D9613_010745 [Agrocybe pediades]|uniref:Uncharacterized protein n=1 Tax=Agrocybe pediades TaxID=84607 RepID=A0A8H4VKI8_9AGAR|nr:hypothetical protein D9613_010745 [Agrocybe pediades]